MRFRTFALVALPAVTGCSNDDLSSTLPSEEDRAAAVAEEIVTGMAKHYADELYEGKVRAFTVDLASFHDTSRTFDPERSVPSPLLEAGLRVSRNSFRPKGPHGFSASTRFREMTASSTFTLK